MAMTTTIDAPADGAGMLGAARRLGPELAARASEGDRLGTMPADLVERLRAAGLFRTLQPRALGGLELAPAEAIEVIAELSRADGSAGWTALIGNSSAFTAWLDPAAALDVFGPTADITTAAVFAPTGRAVPDGDGRFRWSGRWTFASGSRHAEWFVLGGLVADTPDGPARTLPGVGPDWRMAFLPRSSVEVVADWDVTGLRGTGSDVVVVDGAAVDEALVIRPFAEGARQDGPLWRLPFFTLCGVALAGFPLGVGRRALDELTTLAPTKVRAGSAGPLAGDPVVQLDLARAEAGLQAARSFVLDAVADVWDSACAGDVPSVDQRARFQLAVVHAMRAAVDAVDTAFALAGSDVVRSGHPVQRCWRDVHTAARHAYFQPGSLQRWAKVRLGIDQPLFML